MKSLFLFITILCSMFFCSELFTDTYILPKWLATIGGGIIILFCTIIEFFVYRRISLPILHSTFFTCLIISGCIEAILGICTIFQEKIDVTIGTMDNPAGFASCLCLILPYAFENNNQTIHKKIYSLFFCLLAIIAIIVSKSRSGYVSLFIIGLIWAYYTFRQRWRNTIKSTSRNYIFAFIVCFILPFLVWLFYTKKASALGRLNIYTIAFDMILDKPLLGHGLNAISKKYMLYQAHYFQENPDSMFSIYADNVKHIFNHFLELGVMFGLPALFLSVLICVYLARLIPKTNGLHKRAALCSLIGLIPFCLFSYPFYYPFTWLMLFINIYILAGNKLLVLKGKTAALLAGISLFFLVSLSVKLSLRVKAELLWKNISDYASTHSNPQILNNYSSLLNTLSDNPYFLYNYIAVALMHKDYYKAEEIGRKCACFWADYDLEVLRGITARELKNYKQSLKHLELAHNMCPNRLEPLHELALTYEQAGRHRDAIALCRLVLETTPKIYNSESARIKEAARNTLKGYGYD